MYNGHDEHNVQCVLKLAGEKNDTYTEYHKFQIRQFVRLPLFFVLCLTFPSIIYLMESYLGKLVISSMDSDFLIYATSGMIFVFVCIYVIYICVHIYIYLFIPD